MPARSLLALLCLAVVLPAVGADQPGVVRENIEWLDVWVPDTNAHRLPRVLLIGDSITRGYYPVVEQRLKGKAYVARLTTSKSLGDPGLLAEVALVLGQTHFDVVHFNNGMHGWGYTEGQYGRAFPELMATIRRGAPGAKLIWANTTPVRVGGKLDEVGPRTERVRARNRIALAVVNKEHIPVDDLFKLVENHPDYYSPDGVHFNGKGIVAEARQVAENILDVLK